MRVKISGERLYDIEYAAAGLCVSEKAFVKKAAGDAAAEYVRQDKLERDEKPGWRVSDVETAEAQEICGHRWTENGPDYKFWDYGLGRAELLFPRIGAFARDWCRLERNAERRVSEWMNADGEPEGLRFKAQTARDMIVKFWMSLSDRERTAVKFHIDIRAIGWFCKPQEYGLEPVFEERTILRGIERF